MLTAQGNQKGIAQMLEMEEARGKRKRNYVYRGVRRRDDIFQALAYGLGTTSGYVQHDMGNGLYFATSLQRALDYSSPGGCLLVVDWEERGGRLSVEYLAGDEWNAFVKACNCFGTSNWNTPPNQYSQDFLIGAITENQRQVINCDDPVPSGRDSQICARTSAACAWMTQHLIAIFYVT